MFNFGLNFSRIYGGLPGAVDKLLVWLRGGGTSTEKLDTRIAPDAENFTMSQSHCISLNGTDEYGTLDTPITLSGDFEITTDIDVLGDFIDNTIIGQDSSNHIKIRDEDRVYVAISNVSYAAINVSPPLPSTPFEFKFTRVGSVGTVFVNDVQVGSATVQTGVFVADKIGLAIATQYLEGKLYNLRLKDSTQDIHFRMAEGSGMYSFDDTGDRYITWSGAEEDLWGQRQDSYHGNCTDGFGYRENFAKHSENIMESIWNAKSGVTKLSSDTVYFSAAGSSAAIHLEQACAIPYDRDGETFGLYVDLPELSGWSDPSALVYLDVAGFNTSFDSSYAGQRVYYEHSYSSTGVLAYLKIYADRELTLSGVSGFQFVNTGVDGEYIKTTETQFFGTEKLPFLNDERGGTFNGAETSFAPEEKPVGTMNGIDTEILLPFNVPAGAVLTYNGTATATLDVANNKIVDISGVGGTIRNIEVHDA